MTLIAATIMNRTPVMIGDLLVTTKEQTSLPSQILPLHLNILENLTDDYDSVFPVDLNQKVYVINQQLVLGLAGDFSQILSFYRAVKQKLSESSTEQDVMEFLQNYGRIDRCNYIFIGTEVTNGQNRYWIRYSGGVSIVEEPKVFDRCYVAGCGYASFVYEETLLANENLLAGGDEYYLPLATNIKLALNFLVRERLSLTSITERWGGGLEIIQCQRGVFSKLDDYTYIFVDISRSESLNIIYNPLLIANFRYQADLLTIYSSDFEAIGVFYAPPLDKSLTNYEGLGALPDTPFTNQNVVICFLERLDENQSRISVTKFYPSNRSTSKVAIFFDKKTKRVSIELSSELKAEVADEVLWSPEHED